MNTQKISFFLTITFIGLIASALFTGCEEKTVDPVNGSFEVFFEHRVGDKPLTLAAATDTTTLPFTNAVGQSFNVSLFGYYLTRIKLEGPNGELFEDEVKSSADPSQVKGFYHVLADQPASHQIHLHDVPAGKYNKITFTLGIPEASVQEGATAGVLDPAEGAWLWNWDAGYIGLALEGYSPFSAHSKKEVKLHVGGWKEIAGNANMVNNVKELSFSFSAVSVDDKLEPEVHMEVDVLKVLSGTNTVDFSSTFHVHSPAKGKAIADNLPAAFSLDHVHQ